MWVLRRGGRQGWRRSDSAAVERKDGGGLGAQQLGVARQHRLHYQPLHHAHQQRAGGSQIGARGHLALGLALGQPLLQALAVLA